MEQKSDAIFSLAKKQGTLIHNAGTLEIDRQDSDKISRALVKGALVVYDGAFAVEFASKADQRRAEDAVRSRRSPATPRPLPLRQFKVVPLNDAQREQLARATETPVRRPPAQLKAQMRFASQRISTLGLRG